MREDTPLAQTLPPERPHAAHGPRPRVVTPTVSTPSLPQVKAVAGPSDALLAPAPVATAAPSPQAAEGAEHEQRRRCPPPPEGRQATRTRRRLWEYFRHQHSLVALVYNAAFPLDRKRLAASVALATVLAAAIVDLVFVQAGTFAQCEVMRRVLAGCREDHGSTCGEARTDVHVAQSWFARIDCGSFCAQSEASAAVGWKERFMPWNGTCGCVRTTYEYAFTNSRHYRRAVWATERLRTAYGCVWDGKSSACDTFSFPVCWAYCDVADETDVGRNRSCAPERVCLRRSDHRITCAQNVPANPALACRNPEREYECPSLFGGMLWRSERWSARMHSSAAGGAVWFAARIAATAAAWLLAVRLFASALSVHAHPRTERPLRLTTLGCVLLFGLPIAFVLAGVAGVLHILATGPFALRALVRPAVDLACALAVAVLVFEPATILAKFLLLAKALPVRLEWKLRQNHTRQLLLRPQLVELPVVVTDAVVDANAELGDMGAGGPDAGAEPQSGRGGNRQRSGSATGTCPNCGTAVVFTPRGAHTVIECGTCRQQSTFTPYNF